MPLPPINRRKNSENGKLLKHKKRTETKNGIRDKSNSRENTDNSKKSHALDSMNTHRKSDADKSLSSDAQDKGRYTFIRISNLSLSLGSGDPLVYEMKDFAGVTIILRAAPNARGYGNSDGHGKGASNASRRRSEFQQSQLNIADKFEHGDKGDRSGI
jgi:hypothetical protein